MYLQRLLIQNYRSIKELDITFSKGKNVIIGRNNAGKSNIIKALDLMLGEFDPMYSKGENIAERDFYCAKEMIGGEAVAKAEDELFIWCELSRDAGEPLNYDELYTVYPFYIYEERVPRRDLPDNYSHVFNFDTDAYHVKNYIQPRQRDKQVLEQLLEDKHCFAYGLSARKLKNGEIVKDLRFFFRENADQSWFRSSRVSFRKELLQSAIIPSFRDPQHQLRLTRWSWYGKLLQSLTKQGQQSPELKAAFAQMQKVSDDVFREVNETVTQNSLDVAFPGTELHFQVNVDTGPNLYRNCVLYVDDGFKSELTEKGSGIQSATIIGLFTFYTQNLHAQHSALLCVEEPEVYLHPHARRVISDRLDGFLKGNNNQVILTTHSTEFIRSVEQDLNVILVRKGVDSTEANSVKVPDYKSLFIDNTQNELFFADKVILCAGFHDHVLRAISNELFPGKLDEQNISIVSVGSKNNLSKVARLVTDLGIKCFVFADFDYLLGDTQEERKTYGAASQESLLNLGEAFLSQPCIFGKYGGKAETTIEKVRDEIKQSAEASFYQAKQIGELRGKLPDTVQAQTVKLLTTLREHGICLLEGEIEDYSNDPMFISSPDNKLTLDKVYELNARVGAGVAITSLFQTEQIQQFLDVVFSK